MAIFQDDNVKKIHQAQTVKALRIISTHESTSDFTESWTLALISISIQDLHQKLMHLWMEITSQYSFPSRGAYISGQHFHPRIWP